MVCGLVDVIGFADLTRGSYDARVVQEPLCCGRLSSIDVSHNPDISGAKMVLRPLGRTVTAARLACHGHLPPSSPLRQNRDK